MNFDINKPLATSSTGRKVVAVVDYGMGNLRSVSQAVQAAAQHTGWTVHITADPEAVRAADRLVLPGQGAIRDCMHDLRASGLIESVLEAAANKPLFGVCVGMQMMLDHSAEGAADTQDGTLGLGLIPGKVLKFDLTHLKQPDGSRFKVPQMGWNQVRQVHQPHHQGGVHPIWRDVPDNSYFYFVHSYYAMPDQAEHCAGQTDYGCIFAAAIARDNLFATQFHPEKSAEQGLHLYRNFLEWNP